MLCESLTGCKGNCANLNSLWEQPQSGYSHGMRVNLLYFGVLKELLGTAGEPLELQEGANVSALYDHLRERTSNREAWPSLAVAVNREYASLDRVLRDGDEVALLPPVSGGSFADGEKLVLLADAFNLGRADEG